MPDITAPGKNRAGTTPKAGSARERHDTKHKNNTKTAPTFTQALIPRFRPRALLSLRVKIEGRARHRVLSHDPRPHADVSLHLVELGYRGSQ